MTEAERFARLLQINERQRVLNAEQQALAEEMIELLQPFITEDHPDFQGQTDEATMTLIRLGLANDPTWLDWTVEETQGGHVLHGPGKQQLVYAVTAPVERRWVARLPDGTFLLDKFSSAPAARQALRRHS